MLAGDVEGSLFSPCLQRLGRLLQFDLVAILFILVNGLRSSPGIAPAIALWIWRHGPAFLDFHFAESAGGFDLFL
jgi:hypothetical protein